jgi:phosphate transport system substrate-binding protein
MNAIETLQSANVDLLVSGLEPPRGWFATPLLLEPIAIVVNPSNPVRSIDPSQLLAIFSGQIRSWAELEGPNQEIQPVLPLQGDEIRIAFERRGLMDYRPSPNTLLAPTVLAMAELVNDEPGAIGVMPLSQLTEGVRVLQLDGVRPSVEAVADERYPLYLEIVAIAPEEPSGLARSWLVWLQDQ